MKYILGNIYLFITSLPKYFKCILSAIKNSTLKQKFTFALILVFTISGLFIYDSKPKDQDNDVWVIKINGNKVDGMIPAQVIQQYMQSMGGMFQYLQLDAALPQISDILLSEIIEKSLLLHDLDQIQSNMTEQDYINIALPEKKEDRDMFIKFIKENKDNSAFKVDMLKNMKAIHFMSPLMLDLLNMSFTKHQEDISRFMHSSLDKEVYIKGIFIDPPKNEINLTDEQLKNHYAKTISLYNVPKHYDVEYIIIPKNSIKYNKPTKQEINDFIKDLQKDNVNLNASISFKTGDNEYKKIEKSYKDISTLFGDDIADKIFKSKGKDNKLPKIQYNDLEYDIIVHEVKKQEISFDEISKMLEYRNIENASMKVIEDIKDIKNNKGTIKDISDKFQKSLRIAKVYENTPISQHITEDRIGLIDDVIISEESGDLIVLSIKQINQKHTIEFNEAKEKVANILKNEIMESNYISLMNDFIRDINNNGLKASIEKYNIKESNMLPQVSYKKIHLLENNDNIKNILSSYSIETANTAYTVNEKNAFIGQCMNKKSSQYEKCIIYVDKIIPGMPYKKVKKLSNKMLDEASFYSIYIDMLGKKYKIEIAPNAHFIISSTILQMLRNNQ